MPGLTPQRILWMWERRWMRLSSGHRSQFVERIEVRWLAERPASLVARAINRHRRLRDIRAEVARELPHYEGNDARFDDESWLDASDWEEFRREYEADRPPAWGVDEDAEVTEGIPPHDLRRIQIGRAHV